MSAKLPKSWPDTARRILLDAARYYYRDMNELFAVPDESMKRALDWAEEEIARNERTIYEEAGTRWINRWESGKLRPEMERAIQETYRQQRRAEKPIRAHSRKKRGAQLDAEIAESLAKRKAV